MLATRIRLRPKSQQKSPRKNRRHRTREPESPPHAGFLFSGYGLVSFRRLGRMIWPASSGQSIEANPMTHIPRSRPPILLPLANTLSWKFTQARYWLDSLEPPWKVLFWIAIIATLAIISTITLSA